MSERVTVNPHLSGLRCLACGRSRPVGDDTAGCPHCREAGAPANLRCTYTATPAGGVALPYTAHITLGEGDTPVLTGLDAGRLGEADVRLKLEGANPTGSHKDRFSAFAVSRAVAAGYAEVVAASSGNAGISLAAYSARAGLGCKIAVTGSAPARITGLLRDLGAEVHVLPDLARWEYVARFRTSRTVLPVTNYHLPAVGSSPYGIEGFKPVARELTAQFGGRPPDWVVVPSSRGDLAWGVHLGFAELDAERVPRMCLVEPFPRLSAVLEEGADPRGTFPGGTRFQPSIAGNTVTLQAVETVRRTGGRAAVVTDAEAEPWHRALWRSGICLEPSSSVALLAASRLVEDGRAGAGASVAVIGTAHGFKGM
ncbi:pyridoxal-phosphate dependent enzyme [Streptomyces caatingaensis]|uniref:Tryptophan synthase beta chain-like PALP domain-containing protein n=1 Tax=Streptomyces caatingaensis TaxID=1678637 RepID=A0A0K9XGS3_9ACTN|nr:pyridoxal-phosphate dependent enzyme [Streptomyces caatingaensis]KNB52251.1 hypothetical protein AC230_11925 [Streptomyces caatingaensis]